MENGRNKPMPHDDYICTLLVDLVIILGAIVIVLACLLVIATRTHASEACMSKAEARAKYPNAHLWWHGFNRCWDNNSAHNIHIRGHKIAPDVLPVRAEAKPTDLDANGNKTRRPAEDQIDEMQIREEAERKLSTCCWPSIAPFEPWQRRIGGAF